MCLFFRFVAMYGSSAQTALAYAMNDEFSRILAQQMEYFSSDPGADAINRVRGDIAEV
jgi:vesicle-associated membrane protein 7